jgi:mono/diheme cytochrome c family protein
MKEAPKMRGSLPIAALALFAASCSSEPEPLPDPDAGQSSSDASSEDVIEAADTGAPGPIDAGASDAELPPIPIEAEPQRMGDPAAGYTALVDYGYIGCGVPYSAYAVGMGSTPRELKLPGRSGHNVDLPYNFTAFTTTSSVEVVMANCLSCHATLFDGRIVIGLGDASADFTTDSSGAAELAGFLVNDPAERAEWRKWADRVAAVSPYIQTKVIGSNPADNLAAALFARRDASTLAWSATPIISPPPNDPIPVDVPPWWRMKKKNAMFYSASGRGDQARIMMTASTLCVDSVPEARAIDTYFDDVRAYIVSLEPPPYPFAIDSMLADRGKEVFTESCARCHGTYGETDTYPNLLIPLETIGTDAFLALGSQFAAPYVSWFNSSFYGETAWFEPNAGYVAPPLDGIWATAPYLHNGSVPTIAALLESSTRPTYWTRSFQTNASDYDENQLGWVTTVLDHGHAEITSSAQRKRVIDTTLPGYSNVGHTFGDALTGEERTALLEYLKTL